METRAGGRTSPTCISSTSSTPALYLKDVAVSPGTTKKLTVTVQPGKSYYWKIVSKTMAGKTASGPVWSFGT